MGTAPISFGPTEAPKYNRIAFRFTYLRDEQVEGQDFNLLDKTIDIAAANRVFSKIQGGNEAEALPGMVSLITKYMDNKDGTPLNWGPVDLGPKRGEEDTQDRTPRFRGPDGRIHDWSKAEAFLAPEKGSSRKRWHALMLLDEEAEVSQESLVKLLEFVMEVAGKDRTRA